MVLSNFAISSLKTTPGNNIAFITTPGVPIEIRWAFCKKRIGKENLTTKIVIISSVINIWFCDEEIKKYVPRVH